MRLDALNALTVAQFTTALAGIFEHSPWVAERAARLRPFHTREQLHVALCRQVAQASEAEQEALILAHPRLGARGRQRAQLTQSSANEQARAGLDACSDAQYAELLRLNEIYSGRFSMPFILAVRGHTPESILAAMTHRLGNDPATERATALAQIERIAQFRLADCIDQPSDPSAQTAQ